MAPDQKNSADKDLLRISDVARACKVSKQTIEYYIMLGLLEPLRPAGKRGRYFTADHVTRIRLIRKLNASGYTLRSIRETYLSKR